MELKSPGVRLPSCWNHGFNRTFMELKLDKSQYRQERSEVLIVPLWN